MVSTPEGEMEKFRYLWTRWALGRNQVQESLLVNFWHYYMKNKKMLFAEWETQKKRKSIQADGVLSYITHKRVGSYKNKCKCLKIPL